MSYLHHQIGFLNSFLHWPGYAGRAEVPDVIGCPPDEPADLLILQDAALPPSARRPDEPARLLDAVRAPWLLDFPFRPDVGRPPQGMAAHYETALRRIVARTQLARPSVF